MDLREGSEQARGAGDGLAIQRSFILRHAESKAKLRAIRDCLALKTAYLPKELERPFVCPKLVFTGDFGDPEINRAVAMRIAERSLGLDGPAASLWGPRALPQPEAEHVIDLTGPARHAPPPVGATPVDRDIDDAPPVDTERGEPIPFDGLNTEAQQAQLIALAEIKGRLGTGPHQRSEVQIKQMRDDHRLAAWKAWSQLPDAELEPEREEVAGDDGDGQTSWMK
jgi:hypothetical protein